MAYKSASLNLMVPRVGGAEGAASDPAGLGSAIWVYRSADAVATVIAAGYIDDAFIKGLKVNDTVIVIQSGTSIDLCLCTVVDTSSNDNGDATLINGT